MSAIYWDFIEMQHWYWDSKTKRQKDRKIIRQKMMNRTQKTSRRPPTIRPKRGGWGLGEGRGNISGQTIRRPTGWRFSHRHCNKFCHQPKLLRDMPPEISFKILQWCKHTNRKLWEILPPLEDDVKMFGCGGIWENLERLNFVIFENVQRASSFHREIKVRASWFVKSSHSTFMPWYVWQIMHIFSLHVNALLYYLTFHSLLWIFSPMSVGLKMPFDNKNSILFTLALSKRWRCQGVAVLVGLAMEEPFSRFLSIDGSKED